ncbi:MAG: phosphoribosylformylglycinamidine cyclo-ligase [Pseudomonadota bacterium]
MAESDSLTYRDAGVDIDAGNALVDRIKPLIKATRRPGVLSELGGFGGLFALDDRYRQPVLVSGTDGVGTKLKLAQRLNTHHTIGIDLVAMCVNDVLVQGAEPLFFLDYFACGKLELDVAESVVSGIARGCELAGCALIGGETAEMPDMYPEGEYDLAGFCVGVAEREQLITGATVAAGDVILGLPASGPHSNGFSLIRRIVDRAEATDPNALAAAFGAGTQTLGQTLLAPTTIYVKPVLALLGDAQLRPAIHAMAHITGGGLEENLERVIPEGLRARLDLTAWHRPAVFDWLKTQGNVADAEMLRTFNCGVGYCLVVAVDQVPTLREQLAGFGLDSFLIGTVEAAPATGGQ